jgi:hypothetical protein
MAKGVRYTPAPVSPAERETWALERMLDAVERLEGNLGDRVLGAAVVGRFREFREVQRARVAAEKAALHDPFKRRRGRPAKSALVPSPQPDLD